jgi:hypothetical protein
LDIAGWLRSLGLEKYEAAFRENAINEKILPHGGSPEGHGHRHRWARRMLPDAIAVSRIAFTARFTRALANRKNFAALVSAVPATFCWFLSLSRDYNPHGGYARASFPELKRSFDKTEMARDPQ